MKSISVILTLSFYPNARLYDIGGIPAQYSYYIVKNGGERQTKSERSLAGEDTEHDFEISFIESYITNLQE